MTGTNRQTGRQLAGDAHLVQSIRHILSTPRGSVVMLRDYGSEVPRLIDRPINGVTVVDVYMATAEALDRWEPRIRIDRVQVTEAASGKLGLAVTYRTAAGLSAGLAELELVA